MPDAHAYVLFVVAALALLLVPGPAVVYVVARSVSGGRLTGLVSVLGIELGTLTHVVFAAAGRLGAGERMVVADMFGLLEIRSARI